jgi:hypothetical protein
MRISRSGQGVAAFFFGFLLSAAVLAEGRQATGAAQQPPQAKAVASPALPPAQQILDRHTKAIGGRDAILARSSSQATGTVTMTSAGISGTVVMFSAKPNKKLARSTVTGIGDIEEGFNGTIAWTISPMTGPALVTGVELEQRKLDSDFHGLDPAARYDSITNLEQTTFDGRPCYKVRLVRRGGGEDIHFYDVASGLKAGSIVTRETQMGPMTVTSVETDYKPFGGILHATKIVNTVMGLQQVISVTSVEYDKVDLAVFDPPAAIKALIK